MSPPGKRSESNNNLASHRGTSTSQPWPLALILHDHGLWSRPFAVGEAWLRIRAVSSCEWEISPIPGLRYVTWLLAGRERERERTSAHDARIVGICLNCANYSWHLKQMEFSFKFPVSFKANWWFCAMWKDPRFSWSHKFFFFRNDKQQQHYPCSSNPFGWKHSQRGGKSNSWD